MGNYIIISICSDGYERFATIKDVREDITINVHFLEYDEYLESNEKSQKRRTGDTLDGDISIQLVTFSQKVDVDTALIHHQKIPNFPHVEAIIEVAQIIDKYSMYAHSSITDKNILSEFESVASYKVGDRILGTGSLELSEVS